MINTILHTIQEKASAIVLSKRKQGHLRPVLGHAQNQKRIWFRALSIMATLLPLLIFALTIRGTIGNPTPYQIEYTLNKSGQPFETSQERARWALILSLVKEHRVEIDTFASMGTPDIGRMKGHYYSLFPPGLSVAAIPLFILGEKVGASQIMTFLTPTLFTLSTMLLIVQFSRRLGLSAGASLFASFAYAFGTAAFGYSVTLYAHTLSGFLLLAGLFLVVLPNSQPILSTTLAWLLYALSIYVDFPNAFIYFPIALYAGLKTFSIAKERTGLTIHIHPLYLIGPIVCAGAIILYGYYNTVHFGSPFQLSNALPRVQDLKDLSKAEPEKTKNSGQALKTRNIVNGIYTYLGSPDRNLFMYSPVVLLFVFGLGALKKRNDIEMMLLSVAATCFVLYTMFGDPYGGWAFGTRYLIAIMPELLILAAIGLDRIKKHILLKLFYTAVTLYSMGVALMAPLTTNVIPPKIEADPLGLDYTYKINWTMLSRNSLDSFVYNQFLHPYISGMTYYWILFSILALAFIVFIWLPTYENNNP